MSDYTPTTEAVRDAWWGYQTAGVDLDFDDIYYPQFDRWFAEEIRKAERAGWAEGYDTGWFEALEMNEL